jgi:hypothetical protein
MSTRPKPPLPPLRPVERNKEYVDGANVNHWVDPWTRDTTRGDTPSMFPPDTSKPEERYVRESCIYCGQTFLFPSNQTLKLCNNVLWHLTLWRAARLKEQHDIANLLASHRAMKEKCDVCGAGPGQGCKKWNGTTTLFHSPRLKQKETYQIIVHTPRSEWHSLLREAGCKNIPELIRKPDYLEKQFAEAERKSDTTPHHFRIPTNG